MLPLLCFGPPIILELLVIIYGCVSVHPFITWFLWVCSVLFFIDNMISLSVFNIFSDIGNYFTDTLVLVAPIWFESNQFYQSWVMFENEWDKLWPWYFDLCQKNSWGDSYLIFQMLCCSGLDFMLVIPIKIA